MRCAFAMVVLVAGLAFAAGSPARATELGVGSDGGRPPARVVIASPTWRSWDVEDNDGVSATISQFLVPMSLTLPVGDRLDVVALAAFARSQFEYDQAEATLSGLVDGRIKLAWRPAGGWQIGLGAGLPFGDGALDEPGEIAVAQLLWAPILDFGSKRAGEGLTFNADAAWATALSPTVTLGLGAGAVIGSEYNLFDTGTSVTTFRPGTEFSASAGLDWRPDPAALYRADIAYRGTGDDETNGEAAFRAAPRVEVDLTAARAPESWFLALHARGVFRGEDHRYTTSGDDVRRQVAGASALYALSEAYREFSETVSAGLEFDAGSFGESDAALSDGSRFGIGPGLRLGRPGATRAQVRALRLTGSAEDGDIDLSGWDVSAAVFLAF